MSNRGPAVGPWPDWRLMQHARTRLVGEAEPLPLCQKAAVDPAVIMRAHRHTVTRITQTPMPKTVSSSVFILYVRLKMRITTQTLDRTNVGTVQLPVPGSTQASQRCNFQPTFEDTTPPPLVPSLQ